MDVSTILSVDIPVLSWPLEEGDFMAPSRVHAPPSPAPEWGYCLTQAVCWATETQICCRNCTALPWAPELARYSDKPLLEGGNEEESKPPTAPWV